MVSSAMRQPNLLLLLATSILIESCHAFIGDTRKNVQCLNSNSLLNRNAVLCDAPKRLSAREKETGEAELSEDGDETRRHFLLSFPPAISAAAALAAGSIPGASAASGKVDKDDDDKIVLSTSSNNFPKHSYEMTPTSQSIAAEPSMMEISSPTGMCVDDSESRRIAVFERAAPSVVFIDTFIEQRDAFTTNVMEVPLGSGSGIVWDEKGHIITNYHVVRQAQAAQVAILTKVIPQEDTLSSSSTSLTLPKKKQQQGPTSYTAMRPGSDPSIIDYKRAVYQAKVVGVDAGKDIAVLKIDAPIIDLYPIDLGTSKNIRIGQSVLAIGNPFGLDHSLTSGIISGMGREVKSPIGRPISNVIQTDAAINPGNSGGPLLDTSGRLIGLNTAIYSPSGASAGIGFAIPVDSVKFIVDTLIRDGKVIRPVLGISYLESSQAKALGITKGVLVLDVPEASPAYKAGMRGTTRTESGLVSLGDIIVKVEDQKINREADLFEALEAFKPGDRVKVTVDRAELTGTTGRDVKIKQVVLTVELKASQQLARSGPLFVR